MLFLLAEPKHAYATLMLNHCLDNVLGKTGGSEHKFIESKHYDQFQRIWNNGECRVVGDPLSHLALVFSAASYRVTVDGGTNYLYNLQQFKPSGSLLENPDLISGDFDSIQDHVLNHYRQLATVQIVPTPDQDATDFTKAIQLIQSRIECSRMPIYAFASTNGRVDHVLSIMSTLYQFGAPQVNPQDLHSIINIDLGSSISFVLKSNTVHTIPVVTDAQWCSLVPLDGPVELTTTGLKWNLNKSILKFGQFISTSNEFDANADHVQISIPEGQNAILFSSNIQ